MTDEPTERPNQQEIARQNRLRAALRENLKRRKSQSRGRANQPAEASAAGAATVPDICARQTDPDDPS
jgi:hypothetical protein